MVFIHKLWINENAMNTIIYRIAEHAHKSIEMSKNAMLKQ